MKYLYTTSEHYKKFLESNKSNRIHKNLKIWTSGSKNNLLKINEIFETPIDTKYSVETHPNNGLKITFNTNSNTNYRLDLLFIEEFGKLINHISFTLNNSIFDVIPNNDEDYDKMNIEYHNPTGKNEMIEVLNRIHFILRDLVSKKIIINNFCIGGSEIIEKDKIYEYFLKVVVGEDGFEKLNTNIYPTVGWGLYFSI
jgi:hypothetical protein